MIGQPQPAYETSAPGGADPRSTPSSATVHEAAGRTGALPSEIKPVGGLMRLMAPAFTVQTVPGDNVWLHRAVYAAKPGEALVVATSDGLEYGYWGEVLTVAAMARNLAGLVIHGGVRDATRLAGLGWPVFASRLCIRGTTKDPRDQGGVGGPIMIGDVQISPGDIIVGDADGVVSIDAGRARDVLEKSQQREAAEARIMDRLRNGESTLEIYNLT